MHKYYFENKDKLKKLMGKYLKHAGEDLESEISKPFYYIFWRNLDCV